MVDVIFTYPEMRWRHWPDLSTQIVNPVGMKVGRWQQIIARDGDWYLVKDLVI